MGTESDSVQDDAERMAASEEAPDAGDSPPAPAGKKDSPWNSLEWAKLGVAILIPVSILVAGQLFARHQRQADQRAAQHQREADDQKARREAIQKLSRSVLERRGRAELVYSAMVRQGAAGEIRESREEIVRRKKEYDEAFAAWNTTISDNMIVLRQATNQDNYSRFEAYFQKSLSVQVFKKMDTCLTRAYDRILRDDAKEATRLLDECLMPSLLGQALTCGYALTEQARAIVGNPSKQEAAHAELEEKCPPPIDEEPAES